MSGETKVKAELKDRISIYFNENSLGDDYEFDATIKPKQASSERRARVMEFIKSQADGATWNLGVDTYAEQITRITSATANKAGDLGLCSGVLTADWLRQQLPNDDIILMIETPLDSRKQSLSLSAFAALRIIEVAGNIYLYIDGLCSNRRKAGLAMDWIHQTIGQPLLDTDIIQGFKLSALGYVIGYYYKKYGYKFYRETGHGLEEDGRINDFLKNNFSQFVFSPDDEDTMPDELELQGNWHNKMLEIIEGDSAFKTIVKRRDFKVLKNKNDELSALVSGNEAERRETLGKRLELVKDIQKNMERILEEIAVDSQSITPVMSFFLEAKDYSANPHTRIMPRGRTQVEMAEQAIRQDLASDGFYMYKIPERREVSSASSEELSLGRFDPPQGDGILRHLDRATIPKGRRHPRRTHTRKGGRKKRNKTRRKFRKKSKKRKKTRRRRKVKKTRRKRKR